MHQQAIENANAFIRAPAKLLTKCPFCEHVIIRSSAAWKDYTKTATIEAFARHFAAEHDF